MGIYHKFHAAATSTGASAAITWYGGPGAFTVDNLGGGRVDLEFSHDGTTYEKAFIPNSTAIVSLSAADGALPFILPGPVKIRSNIVTASSTGANVWVG